MVGKYNKYKANKLIKCGDKLYSLDSPMIMGVVNVTPDSFYAKSRQQTIENAIQHLQLLIEQKVDIIDVGGVSTRPGANLLSAQEELNRVLPVIEWLHSNFPQQLISVDTFRAEVAQIAVQKGAHIVNDVYGGKYDKNMLNVVARLDVPYILMHCRGDAQNMQEKCEYKELIDEVVFELSEQVKKARDLGVKDIIVDPGFGFAKTTKQNYQLFSQLEQLEVLECPILVGISRKSMLYKLLNIRPEQALNATTALNTLAMNWGASILRVHDLQEAIEVRKIITTLKTD